MSEDIWFLNGVEPALRTQAADEAARLGVSLADYLAEILQQNENVVEFLAPAAPDFSEAAVALAAPFDAMTLRTRLGSLERRLEHAMHALDGSVFGLAVRVGEGEQFAAHTAEAAHRGLAEAGNNLASLRKRLADSEDELGGLSQANGAAQAELAHVRDDMERRLNAIEPLARAAERAANSASAAHAAHKAATAEQFAASAREASARLQAGLSEVRSAANAAAEHADAAGIRLLEELRAMRACMEERIDESAAETCARMQGAFADAAANHVALAERLTQSESAQARTAEHVRAQLAQVESAAQDGIELAAEHMAQAHAALAADFARETQERCTALQAAREHFTGGIADLRERQLGALARLGRLETSVGNSAGETSALRETVERRLEWLSAEARTLVAKAQAAWTERTDGLARVLADASAEAADARAALSADIARVEACTLAALEKLAQDRDGGDKGLQQVLEQTAETARRSIDVVRQQFSAEAAALHGKHTARFERLDGVIATVPTLQQELARLAAAQSAERPLEREVAARLTLLEQRSDRSEADAAIAQLGQRLRELSAQIVSPRRDEALAALVDELCTRLDTQGANIAETAHRTRAVAHALEHISAQDADAYARSEQRLQALEQTAHLFDASENTAKALDTAVRRMEAFELRQAQSLESLRADIAAFVKENNQRLAALEQLAPMHGEHRDLAGQFSELRLRLEERVLGIEQRSVRVLEQISDTVSVLERRFNDDNSADARSA